MSRGLTKAEKTVLQIYNLIDAHQWRLVGTLCPTPKFISREQLKARVHDNPLVKAKYINGRNVVIINSNVWAEEIREDDED